VATSEAPREEGQITFTLSPVARGKATSTTPGPSDEVFSVVRLETSVGKQSAPGTRLMGLPDNATCSSQPGHRRTNRGTLIACSVGHGIVSV
jgi:hypothetical protein